MEGGSEALDWTLIWWLSGLQWCLAVSLQAAGCCPAEQQHGQYPAHNSNTLHSYVFGVVGLQLVINLWNGQYVLVTEFTESC